jgi:hypothetical protein
MRTNRKVSSGDSATRLGGAVGGTARGRPKHAALHDADALSSAITIASCTSAGPLTRRRGAARA